MRQIQWVVLVGVLLVGALVYAEGAGGQGSQQGRDSFITSGSDIDEGGDGNGCSHLNHVEEGDWEPNYVWNYSGWAWLSCRGAAFVGVTAYGAAIGGTAGAAVAAAISFAASELPCDEYRVDERGWDRIRVQEGEKKPLDYYVGRYNSTSGNCYVAWDRREWIYR